MNPPADMPDHNSRSVAAPGPVTTRRLAVRARHFSRKACTGLLFVPDERGCYHLHGIEAKPGDAVKSAVWLYVRYAGVMATWLSRRARTRVPVLLSLVS